MVTASELMDRLEKNPEFLDGRAKKYAEFKKLEDACQADEVDLIEELKQCGFNISSVWDFVNNVPHPVLERKFTCEYFNAYPILVKHLELEHHERTREGIIRALSEPAAYEIAAETLLAQLHKESKKSLRWVIANALESMLPKSEIERNPIVKEVLRVGYL